MSQEKDIAKLKNKLNKISLKIQSKIDIINSTTETSKRFWNSIQVSLAKNYEELRGQYKIWNDSIIPKYYKINVQEDIAKIKKMKFRPNVNIKYRTFIKKDINTQSINALLNSSTSTMLLALDGGEKQLNRLLNLTQQINIGEKSVNKFLNEGFLKGAEGIKDPTKMVGKGSTYGAKKNLQKELMKKSIDGKYISIINKNGKLMQWKISTYAELVARTKLREAQSISTINTGLAYGTDLVQVSSHNTTTPICLPFEGKVFSVTGKDKEFPVLIDMPPFHPNCLHVITTVFQEVLEHRGIQKYIDFSSGKSEIHPTRRGHIPISQRGSA